jgi:hypothetical protein
MVEHPPCQLNHDVTDACTAGFHQAARTRSRSRRSVRWQFARACEEGGWGPRNLQIFATPPPAALFFPYRLRPTMKSALPAIITMTRIT